MSVLPALTFGLACTLGSVGAGALGAGASGPPEPAPSTILVRENPRAWAVQVRGRLLPVRIQGSGPPLALRHCEFISPVVPRGSSSALVVERLRAVVSRVASGPALEAWTGMKSAAPSSSGSAFEGVSASAVLNDIATRELYLQLDGLVVSYGTRIDDALALDAAWPETWPTDVAAGLGPLWRFRGPDRPYRDRVVNAVLGDGAPRDWAPYALAKEITRQSASHFTWSEDFRTQEQRRARSEGGWYLQRDEVIRNGRVVYRSDAERYERNGILEGGPVELTVATVARLRAVGIPARPVYGLGRDAEGAFHAIWGEFYLHGPGWIPFDLLEMRANGVQGLRYDQPWRGFANLPDHARRIPLTYDAGTLLEPSPTEQRAVAPTGHAQVWQVRLVEQQGRPARYELSWSMTSTDLP